MRLDSNFTTALYKSFTYLLTYLLTYLVFYDIYVRCFEELHEESVYCNIQRMQGTFIYTARRSQQHVLVTRRK